MENLVIEGDTNERLILAACKLLAENGYRDATVRKICDLANANVAAVNYHFRDKEGLYRAAWKYALEASEKAYPFDMEVDASRHAPEALLYDFIFSVLMRINDTGTAGHFGRMLLRELAQPTHIFDQIVMQSIAPMHRTMHRIIAAIIKCPIDNPVVEECSRCVTGQLLQDWTLEPINIILHGKVVHEREEIARQARSIQIFSLAGIAAMKEQAAEKTSSASLQ